jgi:hypothetical protein
MQLFASRMHFSIEPNGSCALNAVFSLSKKQFEYPYSTIFHLASGGARLNLLVTNRWSRGNNAGYGRIIENRP